MQVKARCCLTEQSNFKYVYNTDSLTFRHVISHPSSDHNDSFQLFFWDINKIGEKDYANSSQAILQTVCTLLEQSYHYCDTVCKMKLTDDQQSKKTVW